VSIWQPRPVNRNGFTDEQRLAGAVRCSRHASTLAQTWCYVNDDGSHVEIRRCPCFRNLPGAVWGYRTDCPVDAHRRAAEQEAGGPRQLRFADMTA